ncbi:hypothetical protein LP085_30165 [Achromobacter sp. MY14]|uniref:hypothetical protein n=1 Tax=unclassified Achromobacter TaxID=2626865 RepID=UPI001E5CB70E|nr:hypothetical protein [Achromobacter sp. MY14]MCD0501151.1 hypothetical protein [Achromobacter sp. MY14]
MATRQKVARRTSYKLVAIPGSPNQLVLGLKWRTVLGEDLEKLALKTARKARATHFVQSDARSSSVGLLTAKGSETRAKSRTTLFSGAAAFAQMHRHGTHIVACTLPDQSVWLAVVVDGVVQTGGDTIFPDQEKAKNAVEELTARYREHQVHSNYITQARLFSLQQLTAHVNGQSALRRASFRLSMVSPIWWVLIAAVVAYEAWDYGSAWWDERQAKLQEEAQAAQPNFDANALWESAISAWAKSVKTQGGAGMTELLNVILTVPVEPGRWRLTEVDCRPSAGSCTATYRRTRLADNHTLRAALAESFRIVHPDLDTATATWPLPKGRSAPTVALRDLPTAAAIQTTWEPSWQALRPALQDFTLAKPASVQILVPNIKLPNGLEEPVPMPSGTKLPASRALVINAPLRSLYGLALPTTTQITQLHVRYQPDSAPGLAASAFSATLKGDIYVLAP